MSTTIRALREAGELDDYRPGFPSWAPADDASIDAEIAEESACEACGQRGLTYRPYVHRTARRYRAFAVCPACGHAGEF